MLKELASARTTIVDAAQVEPLLYDYGQLKCWAIQQRYESHNFYDNPVFTGVMVRRILMHSNDKSFKKCLDALEVFQTKYYKQHRKDQAKLKKVADALKKHAEKASH